MKSKTRSVVGAFSKLRIGPGRKETKSPKATQSPFNALPGETIEEDAPPSPPTKPVTGVVAPPAATDFQYGNSTTPNKPFNILSTLPKENEPNGEGWQTVPKHVEKRRGEEKNDGLTAPPQAQTVLSWQTDTNWRVRDPKAQKARAQAQSTMLSEMTARSKMQILPGPRTRLGGMLLADMKPGTNLWRYDDRPCNDPKIPDSAKGVYKKPDGARWRKKGRYWIVVEAQYGMVKEVPIYTFNDTGLTQKDPKYWQEYMSVRPKDIVAESFKNQSPTNPVLEVRWMRKRGAGMEGRLVRTTMVACWKEVHKRKLDRAECREVGRLTDDSTGVVVEKAKSPKDHLYEY